MAVCKNCEGEKIVEQVMIGKQGDAGYVGPKYKAGIFAGTTPMYADICQNCGEINRLYVIEDTEMKWITKKK